MFNVVAWLGSELPSDRPVDESMADLIDRCELDTPHTDWKALRQISWAGELDALTDWLCDVLLDEQPPAGTAGFWFGLFNPDQGADVRICGAPSFHPDPGAVRWAVESNWYPKAGEAKSTCLRELHAIAYGPEWPEGTDPARLRNVAEYPLALGYAALAIRDVLLRIDRALLLAEVDEAGVAVGFDSGDFVLLGIVTTDGLQRTSR